MRVVVQRVTQAAVRVESQIVGEIGTGLVALVGVTHHDTIDQADTLARRIYHLRVLRGESSIATTAGAAILVVSQFTLYGDTRRGRRPSWSAAAAGEVAQPLVDRLVEALRAAGATVETGSFGADMALELINDGPVTVIIDA